MRHAILGSRVDPVRCAVLAGWIGILIGGCNESGLLPDELTTTQPSENLRVSPQPPSETQQVETPPPNPPAPPPPSPQPPPDSAPPDYYVMTNRQKFVGLSAYFPGVDRDAISFSIVQGPQHGQLLGTPPNLFYVPTRDFAGVDWFAFQAVAGTRQIQKSVKLSVGSSYVLPLGIPAPEFGINESHWMYAGATYNYGAVQGPYQDAGNGPYTHYVDFNNGNDTGNPFGTQAAPRRTIPPNLPAGSVVELHGMNIAGEMRYTISGQGTAAQPIFIRGPSATNKPVFRRPLSVEGNYVICENLEFDCRDFGPGTSGANWFWVTNTNASPFGVFHHVCLRHSLMRDQPMMDVGQNPAGIVVGVRHFDPALDDPNLLVEHVVAYDVEVRNFAQWDDFVGAADYSGCLLTPNSRNTWILDCHLHHLKGPGIGVNRSTDLANQAPARSTFVGRNYIHQCKESAISYKNGVDAIASQNLFHTFRKSDSSPGFAVSIIDDDPTADWPASDNIWLVFNTIYDSENGILHEPRNTETLPAGKHSRSYMIGNLLFDIHYVRGSPTLHGVPIHKSQLGESRIIGNTIYSSDHGIWLGYAGLTDTDHTTQVVRNNVIANLTERYLALTGYDGMHIYLTPPDIAPMTKIENNLHYENAGRVHFTITQPGFINGNYYTVAELQTATGFGAGSVEGDPLFAGPTAANFHVAAAGPAASGALADDSYVTFKTQFGTSIDYYLDGTPRPASGGAIGALPALNP